MRNYLTFIVLFISIYSLLSCRTAYIPTAANVSLHEKQGDYQVGAYIGAKGLDAHGSAALTNHLMINTNFKATGNSRYIYSLCELGAGYFTFFDKSKVVKGEFIVGAGLGQVKGETYEGFIDIFDPNTSYIDSKFYKFYIQPSVGASTSFGDWAITLRAVALQYYDYEDVPVPTDKEGVYPGMPMYFEPVLTARFGKDAKFTTQMGFSIPITPSHNLTRYYPISLGIGVNIQGNWKKEE